MNIFRNETIRKMRAEGVTLRAIGQRFDLSPERVRQILREVRKEDRRAQWRRNARLRFLLRGATALATGEPAFSDEWRQADLADRRREESESPSKPGTWTSVRKGGY